MPCRTPPLLADARPSARRLRANGFRPRAAGDATTLIERELELEAVARAVGSLTAGKGAAVVFEAGAGLGKTALLDHAAAAAEAAGALVRRADAGPLERHFEYGVVRALLEAPLRDAAPHEQALWLQGAAGGAAELLLEGRLPGPDGAATLAHSVLWLCAAMAGRRPLALVVDDAHWADSDSLRVLSYVARRIGDVPVLLMVGARAEDPGADRELLAFVGDPRVAAVLHPQPLTPAGAARLIRRAAPDAPLDACRACHLGAAGNPWLLGELAHQLAVHGLATVRAEAGLRPPMSAVARDVVRRRMAAVSACDRRVAQARAVVGDGVAAQVVAAVAGLSATDYARARDALVAGGLLAAGGDRIAHVLVADAVRADLPRTVRERLHRAAARALVADGAPARAVAAQLLECPPAGDPEVGPVLVRAAADATACGAPQSAATYLERALAERAPGDDRARMLFLLAVAAFDAGRPDARRRLHEALREVGDRAERIDMLTRLAALTVFDHGDAAVDDLIAREPAAGGDDDTRLAVQVAALDALLAVPEGHAERVRLAEAADVAGARDPLLARVVLAHRAWLAVERGTPDAGISAALALEALDGDLLLAEAGRRAAFHLAVRALVLTDRVDAARDVIGRLREQAERRGSVVLRAGAGWYAGELALRAGDLAGAEREARAALELVDRDTVFAGGAAAVLVGALVARGSTAQAADVLRERGLAGELAGAPWELGVRLARARLSLAEGEFERAHREAFEVGAQCAARGRSNPALTPWRSTAALALAHLGRRDEAAGLAAAELAAAERFGAPAVIATALHARAVAEPDPAARLVICGRGLAVADGAPAPLDAVRLRLELGSALARLGRRVEARGALRPALAAAAGAGAAALAERARRELVATGLRPRRAALEGPDALTPRQRQICDLAARGKGNRAIAQELFLSVKTVETHLAAGYRKLGVRTRSQLAAALRDRTAPAAR